MPVGFGGHLRCCGAPVGWPIGDVVRYGSTMRVLAIGTCRIYGAAEIVKGARRFSHRVHNPAEIERAIDLLQGRMHPWDLSHVLSEYALSIILREPDDFREHLAGLLAELRAQTFDAYVIEISSVRTHRANSDEGPVLVDSIVAQSLLQHGEKLAPLYGAGQLRRVRDLTAAPETPAETRAAMRRIKNRLNAPIVWVSHCGLSEAAPHEEHLARTRRLLAEKVSRFAHQMGDAFVDPTPLVGQHGREAIFTEAGEDLYHYTDLGHEALAAAVQEKLERIGSA